MRIILQTVAIVEEEGFGRGVIGYYDPDQVPSAEELEVLGQAQIDAHNAQMATPPPPLPPPTIADAEAISIAAEQKFAEGYAIVNSEPLVNEPALERTRLRYGAVAERLQEFDAEHPQ